MRSTEVINNQKHMRVFHLCSENRISWIFGLFLKYAQVKTAPLKSRNQGPSLNLCKQNPHILQCILYFLK